MHGTRISSTQAVIIYFDIKIDRAWPDPFVSNSANSAEVL